MDVLKINDDDDEPIDSIGLIEQIETFAQNCRIDPKGPIYSTDQINPTDSFDSNKSIDLNNPFDPNEAIDLIDHNDK